MDILGRTIAFLKASKIGPYSADQRLDALLALLVAAADGHRDSDATEILFDSGLKPDARRAVAEAITSRVITLAAAQEAIAKARPKPAATQDKSSAA